MSERRFATALLWLAPASFTIVAAALVRHQGGAPPSPQGWWMVFGGLCLLVGVGVQAFRWRLDPVLLPIAATLAAVGLAVNARLEPLLRDEVTAPNDLLLRHLVSIILGFGIALGTVALVRQPEWLGRYKYTALIVGIALLALTLVFGEEIRGARLWLRVGPLQLQPTEAIRIAVALFFAGYLAERRELITSDVQVGPLRLPPIPYLMPLLLGSAAAAAILVLQNDLGSALLLFAITVAMLFIATGQTRYPMIGAVTFGFVAWLASPLFSRLAIRSQNWIDPWVDPLATGFQQVQSEWALATGGLLGQGLGAGSPNRIPDVHTDFVIAAIGEELGLVGTLGVIVLLGVFSMRGFMIALRSPSTIGRLLAAGLATSVAGQTLLILGGVGRLIPLTGLTLPFISYGGTSMLISFLTTGLLLAISRDAPRHQHHNLV